MKWRVDKKEGKRRLVSKGGEEDLVAPMMELTDGLMEQMEAMVKELRRISGGIWTLVEGVGKLMEVMEWLEKMGAEKVEKGVEMEIIQKVDKGIETEILLKEESKDNSKEEKEEDKVGNGDKEMDGDEKN
jgi:hypothetical protein